MRAKALFIVFIILAVTFSCGKPATKTNKKEKTASQISVGQGTLPEYKGKAPEDGDWFIRNLGAEPPTLNPVTSSDIVSFQVYKWIFSPLFDMDENMHPVPVLATSWEISPDHLTMTFHLRRDVKWHDGIPFTSKDVLFTFNKIMDPNVDAINKRADFEKVKGIEAPDDYTFVVKWKEAYVPGFIACENYIVPEHIYKNEKDFNKSKFNFAPIGTGPYKFLEWKMGERIVLEANRDYFDGSPHIKRAIFKFIHQGEVSEAAFNKGELDINGFSSADKWIDAKNNPSFTKDNWLFEYYGRNYMYIGWNMDGKNPFFGDKRVRKAMTYVCNRKAMVEKLRRGLGAIISGPLYYDSEEYDKSVETLPFDLEKASKLLDESGWKDTNNDGIRDKNGIPFNFEITTFVGAEEWIRILELYQQDLKKIGISMTFRTLEWSVFQEKTGSHQFTAFLIGWSFGDDPDLYLMFHSSQSVLKNGKPIGMNHVSYKNPEVDRLIEEERVEFDQKKRIELFHNIHKIIAEDQPLTFLYIPSYMVAVKNRFQNVRVSQRGYGLFTWYPSMKDWWVPKSMQVHKE